MWCISLYMYIWFRFFYIYKHFKICFPSFLCGKIVQRRSQWSIIHVHVSGNAFIIYMKSISSYSGPIHKKYLLYWRQKTYINIRWWPNNSTALSGEQKHLKWHSFCKILICGLIVSITWPKTKLLIIRPMGIEGDA